MISIKKYCILLLMLLFAAIESYADSQCHAVQLKLYPTNFLSIQKDGGRSRRTMSMAFNIRYRIYKIDAITGQQITLFTTGDECYNRWNTNNSVFPLEQMNQKEKPFYVTLCFEDNVDLSTYHIEIISKAWGWNQVMAKNNHPNCNGSGSDNSTTFDVTDNNLADLNTTVSKKIRINKGGNHSSSFGFVTKIEKTDIPYPQYSIPEEITACKNIMPYTLELEDYSYNLKMRYFSEHKTTISKFNTSTNTWQIYNGYNESTASSFPFNNANDMLPTCQGGKYAVFTKLNNDCQMADTFTLRFIDTAIVSNPVPPFVSICQNGIGNIVLPTLPTDTFNKSFLWKDLYGNCLLRSKNLPVEDTGTYTLTITQNNGCYARYTSYVEYKTGGIVKFAQPEIFSCLTSPPPSITLTPITSNFSSYKWSTGDVSTTTTINRAGVYKLSVINSSGCPSSAYISVIDTCVVPVHEDVTAHSWTGKIDKINFKDATKNSVVITDPRTLAGAVGYGTGDIVQKKSFVRLQYHRSELSDFKDSVWTLSVPYQITIDNNAPVSKTLLVKKTNAGEDIYESVFEHEGGNVVTVQLNAAGITVVDRNGNPLAFSAIPNDINIEAELQVLDVPKFTAGVTAINDAELTHILDNGNKKIKISWEAIKPAIEYELQITFIDEQDKNNIVNDNLFKSKGWSVTISDNTYTLDATYPQGKLVYRVRPVGRNTVSVNKNYNHILNGKWSVTKEVDINTNANLSGFELDKNWSKVVTFAEEGKKKEVVSYMDGLLRPKQALTNLNTEKLTLAQETYYDNESRATLGVIPVPLQDNNLTYKTGLALSGGQPIDKNFVDNEVQQPLDNSAGAANYYSSSNSLAWNSDFTNKVNMAAIPDAEGYVTTKVEFSRDNTGRITKQSGIGKEFAIGDPDQPQHHYTQYFYATPTQTELNRLFGSNIGKAVFYSKKMVVDPNGQVSITYLDNNERTIATALAGDSPENLESLDTIDKPTPVEMPFNMSDNNIRDSIHRMSTSVNIIPNDVVNKNYEFHYNIGTGKDNDITRGVPYCKDCKYKLEISVTDEKGAEVALSANSLPSYVQFVTDVNNNNTKIEGVLDAGLCNNPSYVYDEITFNAQFGKLGNYTYTKKLTLLDEDEASVNDYLNQIGFPVLDSFIAHNIGKYIDSLACRDDCPSRVAVYIRDVRRQDSLNNGGVVRSAAVYKAIGDSLVAAGYCDPFLKAQFQAADYANRRCEELLSNIIRQISPNEKFFTKTCLKIRNATSPQKDSLIAWGVYTADNSDAAIKSRWLFDWGRKVALLFKGELHPEFCHYENCISDTATNTFDTKMGLMSGFTEAKNKGYISVMSGTYESNNRVYDYGTVLNNEIDNTPGLRDALNKYIDFGTRYLVADPTHPITSRVHEISIINAVKPRTVYYRPNYLSIADSGYNTARIYYTDSLSYDINGNHIMDTPELDSAFWIHFSAAFLAAKKMVVEKKHLLDGCTYLNDEDALVKNVNMTNAEGLAIAQSYNNQDAYCATCPAKAVVLADKLARECPAIMTKYLADTAYRRIIIDSLRNYCYRSCGVNNPQAIITHNAIMNGDLNGIRDYIVQTIPDATNCRILDILDSGIEYNYATDSAGNVIITYICEGASCSIASIIDIANSYDFNYPKTDSILFREGFDGGPSTAFVADSIYKVSAQNNGLIVNVPLARQFMDSTRHDFGEIAGLVCFTTYFPSFLDLFNPVNQAAFEAFKASARNSLNYIEKFYDVSGDSLGHYLLNYTGSGTNFNGVFWQNPTAIKIQPNKTYLLSYYLANHSFNNTDIVPVIVSSDGIYADTLQTIKDTLACMSSWNKYNFYWTAPAAGIDSIYIKLYNKEQNGWGNDFSLDEIKLELVSDTTKPKLSCPNVKDYKYNITPSEITVSYASCDNDNLGGGLYTIFFVDSLGHRVDSIRSVENAITVSVSPVMPAPTYGQKSVQYLGQSYNALLINGDIVKVFAYQASCAMPNWNFTNNNNATCSQGQDLFNFRNNYLNQNTNYACQRSFDTCVLTPHQQILPPRHLPCDSDYNCLITEWTPDTSFQSCINRQIEAQMGWLTQAYNDSLSKIMTAYQSTHIANCFKNLNEDFYYKTTINEYHYTLYYYDQNESLVQTVPPQGVFPVSSSGFSLTGKWQGIEPRHVLKTVYQYNTRYQPVVNHSPDGGLTQYWYNKKGMQILSQNEKQKTENTGKPRFSFKNYDALGRIVLAGELETPSTGGNNNSFGYDPTLSTTTTNPTTNALNARKKDTINQLVNQPMFPLSLIGVTGYKLINLIQTEYDQPSLFAGINQTNVHNRVSATYAYDDYEKLLAGDGIATIYSYDEIGNIKIFVQDLSHNSYLAALPQNVDKEHLKKQVDYDFDLLSGKVNAMVYNNSKDDELRHFYEYDADNRITDVYTADKTGLKTQEAKYFYFPHGPLARIEIGQNKVQSEDYAYTLQNWLKSTNANTDYSYNILNNNIGLSQVSSILGYYQNDYKGINIYNYENEFDAFASFYKNQQSNKNRGLYNGNIIYTVTDLRGLAMDTLLYGSPQGVIPVNDNTNKTILGMEYKFDQLNRLVAANGKTPKIGQMNQFQFNQDGYYYNNQSNENRFSGELYNSYKTNYKYDANGNITFLNRYAPDFTQGKIDVMDSLSYLYAKDLRTTSVDVGKLYNNRLYHVNDRSNIGTSAAQKAQYAGRFKTDIDDQGTASMTQSFTSTNITSFSANANYQYDKLGNMTKDVKEGIYKVTWTPNGKIDEIQYSGNKPNLKFLYDALGNKVAKVIRKLDRSADSTVTYYYRDAEGSTLDIVEPQKNNNVYSEKHDYSILGSSRIGVYSTSMNISTSNPVAPLQRVLGKRQYELDNYLGNVLTTVTDQKYMQSTQNYGNVYKPVVSTVTDYYPYGMPMPARTYPGSYNIHEDCSNIDSSGGYALALTETYNVTNNTNNWNWKSGLGTATITQTTSGLLISKNTANANTDMQITGVYKTFANAANKRYRITYTIDSLNYFGVRPLAEFNHDLNMPNFEGGLTALGAANLCELEAVEKILIFEPTHNGTRTIEFMGTGDAVAGLGLACVDSATFKIVNFKIEEKTFISKCDSAIAYNKNYTNNTLVNDWHIVDIGMPNVIDTVIKKNTSTTTNRYQFKVTGVADGTQQNVMGVAYVTIPTIAGYDYTVNLNGVSITRSNTIQFEQQPVNGDTSFTYFCLIGKSIADMNNQDFLMQSSFGSCCNSANISFTAQSTSTVIAFMANYQNVDVNNNSSVILELTGINIKGYKGSNVTRNINSNKSYLYSFNGQLKESDVNENITTAPYWEYDARTGRRWNVDPVDFPWLSPYSTNNNNPISYNDPNGDCPNCVTAAIGAGLGFLIGGGIEVGIQLYKNGKVTNWKKVGGTAVQGAITGGAAGFTGGASLATTLTVGGVSNGIGGAVNDKIQGKKITTVSVASDVMIGVFFAGIGYGVNKLASVYLRPATGSIVAKLLPCGCFVSNTKVLTSKGLKDISEVVVGDTVVSYNEKLNTLDYRPVTQLLQVTRDTLYKILIGDNLIEASSDHPFYRNGKWVAVRNLKTGDSLSVENGKFILISDISYEVGQFKFFNFEVDEFHTYFVSDSKVLVHNGACDIIKSSGFYRIIKSGTDIYIGKGNQIARAGTSLAAREGEQALYYQVTKGVAGKTTEQTALVYEHLAMDAAKKAGYTLKNEIASPGKKIFESLTKGEQATFEKAFEEILGTTAKVIKAKK